MPIQINELVVNTTVTAEHSNNENSDSGNNLIDKKAIIQECVEQVLEILKNKEER
ncbi:MAG: DUF5908 family protein [Bacteroidales bacterium]|jgi:hypothetical protein